MIYEFRCRNCGAKLEKYMKLSEFTVSVPCSKCGGRAENIISMSVPLLFQESYDEQTDLKFTGRRQKVKALQRAGFEEIGLWKKDDIEERKYRRKKKREGRKKRQQNEGEIKEEAKKRTEAYFSKRGV